MNFRTFGETPDNRLDGSGKCMTIPFQGCLAHCKGCGNPGVWPMCGGEKWDTESVKRQMVSDPLLTGISLEGGEPFLQPVAALDLARFAHSRGLTVRCRSGYSFNQICEWEDTRKMLLREIDILEACLIGSENECPIDVKKSLVKREAIPYEGHS